VEGERKDKEGAEPPTLEKTLVYEIWEKANAASIEILRSYTLQDLHQQREARAQQSPMYYI
jgi:DNA-binding IscR family transcriptional regulator